MDHRNDGTQSLSVMYVLAIFITLWLTVITVVFGFYYNSIGDGSDYIKKSKNNLEKILEEIVTPCCANPATNCTCQGSENTIECWDAQNNVPFLESSVGNQTRQYVVCNSGTTNLNGVNFWVIGDFLRFNPDTQTWFKNDAEGRVNFEPEVYDVEFTLVDENGLTPNSYNLSGISTTVSISIFDIGNGFGIMNIPTIALTPSPEENQPCGFSCNYPDTRLVSTTPIPNNRRTRFGNEIKTQVSVRNCYAEKANQCGPACPGININSGQREIAYGLESLFISTIDGLFSMTANLGDPGNAIFPANKFLFRGCPIVRPVSFLYKFNT